MSCTAQNSLTTSGSTFAKPVFAPGLKTIAEASSLAYVQAVGESYTAQGAPRLHYGARTAESDGNGVVQITLAGCQMSPLMRPVFVPDLSSYASLLIEGGANERGLVLISCAQTGTAGQVTLILTIAPYATVSDISQGDHNGILQIMPPTQDILSTTMTLQANVLGDYEYTTQSSTVAFSTLSNSEIADLTQRLEGETSDLVAAIAANLMVAAPTRLSVGEALRVTELGKTWIIGGLQIVGALATLGGGILGAKGLHDNNNAMKYWGIGLSTLGGLCRGAAGMVGAFLEPEDA
ncbi:hypothetical protein [Oceanicaulis sp. UBA6590]|uniref:hypothetical protein n=1 Tax=Oceanicaulis sp. UBA6590 TaxID=1947008 RepID=UPI000E8B3398|nr:hypothetical protein [Oceanicaulis sp. UBA6590]HBU62492.1 hypothetical protein [Oceanicaulis sp.]|tara:strand:- start:1575 stop:2453 length:879 start_codon:yes stop_codon:yes gene_type:complete